MEYFFESSLSFPIFSENTEQKFDFLCPELATQSHVVQESVPQKPIKFILTKVDTNPAVFLKKKTQRKKGPSNGDMSNGRWTREEQQKFAEAVYLYGSDWKRIQAYIKTRCGTQVRSHAQKFLMRLKENPNLLAHGLQKNLSWTKTISYLTANLSREEMKEALEAVELGKNDPVKEKKEKVEKGEKIKKIRKKDKGENKGSKEKNGKKEKKEKKEKNGMSKPKKCKVLGKSSKEKKEKVKKKRYVSFEKGFDGKKKKSLEGKNDEMLKITLRLEPKSEEEESLTSNSLKSRSESIHSYIQNEEKNESNSFENKEESSIKNEGQEKGQKQSKISSSTEFPESEYGGLTRKEDEETGRFDEGLNYIYNTDSIMKQRLINSYSMIRRNSIDDDIEIKMKTNCNAEHYGLDNLDYEESKNLCFKESNFDLISEDLQKEMIF